MYACARSTICLESDRADHRLVLPEEAGVDVDGIRVLGWDIDVLEDRVHRANDLALLAVDAHVGIDIELWCTGPGYGCRRRGTPRRRLHRSCRAE